MELWGSLGVVVALALVHLTIARWRMLHGPRAHVWLSISAGTALAYVFAYLLPSLASTQATLTAAAGPTQTLLHNHVYVFALVGLLTYFALLSTLEQPEVSGGNRRRVGYAIALQTLGYSFYSLQLGYLAADIPYPEISSYTLVALILGLHLMGIDHHLHRMHATAYQRLMRFAYVAALFAGWAGGMTRVLESTVTFSSTFVAGGIIITAIREELPGRGEPKPLAFFVSAIVSCALILIVQYLQFD